MTITSTILIKFHLDFIGKSCNICRIWGWVLYYPSNSVWSCSFWSTQNRCHNPH